MLKRLFPKSTKKIDLIKEGRAIFKEIQTINENAELNDNEKITKITKILTKNKTIFSKKDYLDGDSLLNFISRYNTDCLRIPSIAKKYDAKISDSIQYLATQPELTFLIGKELNQYVNESLHPPDLMDEQAICQEQGDDCDEKNYNRNKVICDLQKGSMNNKDVKTPTCVMAQSCSKPNVVNDEEVSEVDTIPKAIVETNNTNSDTLTNEEIEELKLLKDFKKKTCTPLLEDYKKQSNFEIEGIKASRADIKTSMDKRQRKKGGNNLSDSDMKDLEEFKNFKQQLCSSDMERLKKTIDKEMRNEVNINNQIRENMEKDKKQGFFKRMFAPKGGTRKKRSTRRKHKSKSNTKKRKSEKHKTRSKK